MITLPAACARVIARSAEAAWPEEGCGLLVGTRARDGGARVTRVVPGRNCALSPRGDRFEIDPALRLGLMREVRGTAEDVVGHFHSHPDAPARPSARDAEMAFEPDLIWIIVAVAAGRAGEIAAFRWDEDAKSFRPLRIDVGPPSAGPADENGLSAEGGRK